MSNIALIGFMGSGKSTVGRIVADNLEYEFVDTDRLIEERAGKSIARIFEEEGEDAFRDLEARVVRSVCGSDRQVISLGGGAVLRPENREHIRTGGRTVYLRLTEDEILSRTTGLRDRPLLAGRDREARVRELMSQREALYEECADIVVDAGGAEPERVAEAVIAKLGAL